MLYRANWRPKMAVTRINNNQITDAVNGNTIYGINANTKLQNYSITSTKIANNLTYGSDFTISGNLTVNGTTTTVDTVNTLIADPLITLADGQTSGVPTVDIGFIGLRGAQNSAVMAWQESSSQFVAALSTTTVSNTTFALTSYADFSANNITTQGNLSVVGNVTGNLNATSYINAGNVTTPGFVSATGNIQTANFFIGDGAYISNISGANVSATKIANGTSYANIATANGNLDITIDGNSAATFYNAGASVANLSVIGNVIGNLNATDNITANNVNAVNTLSAGGNIVTTNSVNTANLSLSGNVISALNVTTDVTANNLSATSSVVSGGNISTSTGTLNGANLSLSGNVISNITGDLNITATGNLSGGNISTAGILSVTGTATVGNLATAGTASATGNVTGGNIITAGLISATGDIYGANISATGDVSAFGNVTGNAVITDLVTTNTALVIETTAGNAGISIDPHGIGNINVNTSVINNVANPIQAADAANKEYVDAVASGLDLKASCEVGTLVPLDTETEVTNVVYNNGTSGVGATLTITTTTQLLIDGVDLSTLNINDRVLIKNELDPAAGTSDAAWNGIYTLTSTGALSTVLTRAVDFDNEGTLGAIPGSFTFVIGGGGQAGTGWVCITTNPITMGTTPILWAQFSGAGQYTAGNAIAINGTIISALFDGSTVGVNGSNQLYIPANAPLTTPNIGAATGTSLSLTGNVDAGNVRTGGLISATGDITGGNITATANLSVGGNVLGNLNVTENVVANNVLATTSFSTAGNVIAGNVNAANLSLTGNVISALNVTGDITGNNIYAVNVVSAAGNITAANFTTTGSAGNVTGANNIVATTLSATANVFTSNLSLTGNVLSTLNVDGNIQTANFFIGDGYYISNINAANVSTTKISNGNSQANIGTTDGNLAVTINSNLVATFYDTGVSTVGNITSAGQILPGNTATYDLGAAGLVWSNIWINNLQGDVASGVMKVNGGQATVDFAVNGTGSNVFYVNATTNTASFGSNSQVTNAIVAFNANSSIVIPAGNVATRPSVGVTGMIRFNSTNNYIEVFDNSQWVEVGATQFTVITDQQFNGDGSTVAFTLSDPSTTAGSIVSINGVQQIPTTAYSISSTTLTFTEAPATGDLIDVRSLATTVEVVGLSNGSGNAQVQTSATSAVVEITGNMLPAGNLTQSLGSNTNRWSNLWVGGNTIFLGNLQLKEASANTFAVYTADGVTEANIAVGNIDVTSIQSGTSTISIAAPNGNAVLNVAGTDRIVATTTGAVITGTVSATGNITGNYILGNGALLTGVITSVANINSGTSNVTVLSSGGNVLVGVGGANIVTFTSAGIENAQANATGNIGNSTNYFNTVFAKATSAQYADLAEKYTADAEYAPGTVVSFGGDAEVTQSSSAADRAVAGVVSTNPSYIMNAGLEGTVATVALTGRVPTKVTGSVRKGDLMVSNGDGTARAEADPKVGTVIGKALENFDGATGTIEVVVGRF